MLIYPTQERLLELFEYNPDVGSFKRLKNMGRNAKKDMIIFGTNNSKNYLLIRVDGYKITSHKLAWIISNGEIPKGLQIDHINRNRSDNRLCNLRAITQMENCHNQTLRSTNVSGYTGVFWHNQSKKWRSKITINYKHIHLGGFDTKEEAYQAYLDAKKIHHPSSPIN